MAEGSRDGLAPPGKLLGLDVGLARIGVAVCDPLWLSVRPLLVLMRGNRRDDFAQLAQLVQREEVVAVVCGLPLSMDGGDSQLTNTVRKWAMRLAHALRALLGRPLPIFFWDERLSTYTAKQQLASQRQSAPDDALAAAVILQSYLQARRLGEQLDYGRIELPAKGEGNHFVTRPSYDSQSTQ
jgi:putative Holliday junction resolvase